MELIMLSISGSLALLIAEVLDQLRGLGRHVAEPLNRTLDHAGSMQTIGNCQHEGLRVRWLCAIETLIAEAIENSGGFTAAGASDTRGDTRSPAKL